MPGRFVIFSSAAFLALTLPASAQNYGEIYGGGVFERSENYGTGDFDLDTGTAVGFGVYASGILGPGIEIGLDVMHTESDYIGFNTSLESNSALLVARWSTPLSAGTSFYTGAGLGAIRVRYDGSTSFPAFTGDDTVSGGQLSIGLRYAVGPGQIFTELKHQETFDDASIQGVDVGYSSSSLLAGYRFSF